MSGTYMDLHVPPTLVTFAVGIVNANRVVSQEFKQHNSKVVLLPLERDENEMPDFVAMEKNFVRVTELIKAGVILAAQVVKVGGLAAAISKMSFGNKIGMDFIQEIEPADLFRPNYGALLLEVAESVEMEHEFRGVEYSLIGHTWDSQVISVNNTEIDINEAFEVWEKPLEKIFPTKTNACGKLKLKIFDQGTKGKSQVSVVKPRIFIPVFPGTNCEYDSARAFEKAGGWWILW
ncbi:hypothetical protein N752_15750 [Desulforamulus aquiferis]|nr:hypothetical protein N752_15750 [Desulforamulus aquiferis]